MNFKTPRNLLVIAAVLAVTGFARMPVEQKFTDDLRERKIVQPRIDTGTWSDMGQTSLAGAFGGLRTVMASMLSLKAQSQFENNEWYDLKKNFNVITTLDPYNVFYWSHGGWHIGYNAAAWARNNREFSPSKRRLMEMNFIEEGEDFFRRGLQYLPEKKSLWFEIGAMWSNEYKRPDLERAAEAFKMSRDSGNSIYRRRYLITIARIPGREVEAFEEVIRLVSESPRHLGLPTIRCLLVVLSTNPELPAGSRVDYDEVFNTKEKAYQDLYNYRKRVLAENYYKGEIDEILKELIVELDVPDELNPFVNSNNFRIHTEHWREALEQSKGKDQDLILKKDKSETE